MSGYDYMTLKGNYSDNIIDILDSIDEIRNSKFCKEVSSPFVLICRCFGDILLEKYDLNKMKDCELKGWLLVDPYTVTSYFHLLGKNDALLFWSIAVNYLSDMMIDILSKQSPRNKANERG